MKLFWHIFFSFWIATILMLALVLSISEVLPMTFPGDHEKRFEPEVAVSSLNAAVNTYEAQGRAAFQVQIHEIQGIHRNSIDLFDSQGNPLIENGADASIYSVMAKDVLRSGHSELIRLGFRTVYACPLQSVHGRRYAAVLTIFKPVNRLWSARLWFNLTIAMFPAGLVCMLLALYITRPISRLQNAAKRLASGELDARAGPLKLARRDELADLARDFDTMAAQIQLLMTAQRRFVADVSHELGAPLTRMHLALALLRRRFAGIEDAAWIRIERETDKLSNLVQQLLLLAGLEAGRIPAETFAPVSIQSLCENIIEDANFEAAHANCRVTGTRQDITLLAYPNLLRRAIDNILRNALRYAPEGTEIQLDCRVDRIRQQVTLDILDRGPGVPSAMLGDIFRPFFRTAPGRETSSGGTGLGLAIASEAVRLHDGSIEARNRQSGGLQVTIILPLRIPVANLDLQHDEANA